MRRGFDFYYVMRHVDACIEGDTPRPRAAPRDEPLRLTQHASLMFAPPRFTNIGRASLPRVGRLSVHHFGLFGPNGALPQHITEYVQERSLHYKDDTIARFCDIFLHRMILCSTVRGLIAAVTSLDNPGRDHFGRYVASLVGLGQQSLRDRDSVPDHLKLHHAGHPTRQTRNPEGLIRGLSALLRVPVSMREYCTQWLRLAEGDRTRLVSVASAGDGGQHRSSFGTASSRLGQGRLLAPRCPMCRASFVCGWGAMPLAEFEALSARRSTLSADTRLGTQLCGRRDRLGCAGRTRTQRGTGDAIGCRWPSGLDQLAGHAAARRNRDADDVILDAERLTDASAV